LPARTRVSFPGPRLITFARHTFARHTFARYPLAHHVNTARLILVSIICVVPLILIADGGTAQGIVGAALACGIAAVAVAMPAGEAAFMLKSVRGALVLAAIPIGWMVLQMLPLESIGLAHPIWQSAEQALGIPLRGSVSIDPGATALAFGRAFSALAVMLLAAAVGASRERAEWVLFALVAGTALAAAVVIAQDLAGVALSPGTRAEGQACAAIGTMVAAAACFRTFERSEGGHRRSGRRPQTFLRTFVPCGIAFGICIIAAVLGDIRSGLATVFGLGAFGTVMAARRLGIGFRTTLGILGAALAAAVIWGAASMGLRLKDLVVEFAPGSAELIAASQRMLSDAPWLGTGAGTFGALLPLYRDVGEAFTQAHAPTAAAAIAIELGWPLLLLTVVALLLAIAALVRGAFARGRDAFYPATGASALLSVLVLSFCNNGVLGGAAAICIAAITGVALVQRQSRSLT